MRTAFRHLFVAGLVALGVIAAAAACGIDFPGSADIDPDGSSSSLDDGAVGDGGFPVGCATLATPCLGTLPPGWRPIAMGAPQCAAGFTAAKVYVNPQVGPGACACGPCQTIGSFKCDGMVTATGGDNCNDPQPVATLTSGNCGKAHAQHIRGLAPQANGAVGCFAPNDAGKGATTETLAVCVPGCSADFCASGSRCIVADGAQVCPNGFQLRANAGLGADPGCPPCECEAGAPGKCGGTITAYESTDCSNNGAVSTYPIDTCHQFAKDYNSLLVKLVPPSASCSAALTSPVAQPSLVAAKTICCQ
jgi:hypothetical protein